LQIRQRLATDFANATDKAKQGFEQTVIELTNTRASGRLLTRWLELIWADGATTLGRLTRR